MSLEEKANEDRGEMMVRIGGHNRLLKFRSRGTALLESYLESDPLAFVAGRRGPTTFVVMAILAGLAWDEKTKKTLTKERVHTWIDDTPDFDGEAFTKQVMYAIARGKPGDEGKNMVRVLDDVFNGGEAGTSEGQGPTSAA